MTLTAEQKLDIHELGRRIYLHLDSEDAPGFVSLFAEDGVVSVPYGEFTGLQAIREFMDSHIAAGREKGVKHFIANIEVDEVEAGLRARFYILKMNVVSGPAPIATAAGEVVAALNDGVLKIRRFALSLDPAVFNQS